LLSETLKFLLLILCSLGSRSNISGGIVKEMQGLCQFFDKLLTLNICVQVTVVKLALAKPTQLLPLHFGNS
jgi:hypothetical protein